MELDVTNSLKVTNASVQPLIEARKLRFLMVGKTRIDDEHYALILSELPNIALIIFLPSFQHKQNSILRHIAVGRLDTVTHVKGTLQDIDTLAHKCPNITTIDMGPVVDLSGLTAFNALSALSIHNLHYGNSNLKAVLQGVGHRLTELNLSHGKDVVLQEIISLCPSLASLCLIECSFLSLNSNTPIDPQLPHFTNLSNLYISCPYECRDIPRYIYYYVSLKTIELIETRFFSVQIVRDILNRGTFKQLEILRAEKSYRENIEVGALQLLIAHCPLLKCIELEGLTLKPHRFRELKRQIELQNFDLKFIVKEFNDRYLKHYASSYNERLFSWN
jgi:hypothetical protein